MQLNCNFVIYIANVYFISYKRAIEGDMKNIFLLYITN